MADQLRPDGYIPSSTTPGQADLGSTANAILALASAGVDPAGAPAALAYMQGQVDNYVPQDGADGPGQLALLILDAHALGANPASFGGTDLVSRLLGTEQTSGTDAGLFGTEDQVDNYAAGVYDQGLALAALAGVGVTSGSDIEAADVWLHQQQCPDGGWTSYENVDNPCNGSPADYEGPDTNSTALAIEGLSAEGDLGGRDAAKALRFITHAQDGDGGWGYEPNAADSPGFTDPDSTALVIQAILALGKTPTIGLFDHGTANPVATLESFQLSGGSGNGAFTYPGISGPNMLATYQAVPALSAVLFPFDVKVTTTSLPAATVGAPYRATLSATGGSPPYKWTIIGATGALPAGLRLSKSTGTISGQARASGTASFAVEVSDAKTTSVPHTHNVAWKVLSITS